MKTENTMITDVFNNKISTPNVTKNKKVIDNEIFSFLTNYKSFTTNSPTRLLHPSLQLISRITTKGKIKFCNTDFCIATKKSANELKNSELNSIFHSEMPKTILEIVKAQLKKDNEGIAILKSKDIEGNTIWLNALFIPNTSSKNYTVTFTTKLNPCSKKTINKIEKIYNTIYLLETHVNKNIAKKYFDGLLEMEYGDYDGFIINAFQ